MKVLVSSLIVVSFGAIGFGMTNSMLQWSEDVQVAVSPAQPVNADSVKLASTRWKPISGNPRERAILAAGCFWGVEYRYRQMKGVTATASGYIGGRTLNPTYREVLSHTTGHAEAVMIEFDPKVVSYSQILEVFWESHNPTTKNRQGPDIGDQYRSAIFYLSPDQRKAAAESMKKAQARFTRPIVTELSTATTFWMAEDYHQQYSEKNGKGYCPIDRSNHVGG